MYRSMYLDVYEDSGLMGLYMGRECKPEKCKSGRELRDKTRNSYTHALAHCPDTQSWSHQIGNLGKTYRGIFASRGNLPLCGCFNIHRHKRTFGYFAQGAHAIKTFRFFSASSLCIHGTFQPSPSTLLSLLGFASIYSLSFYRPLRSHGPPFAIHAPQQRVIALQFSPKQMCYRLKFQKWKRAGEFWLEKLRMSETTRFYYSTNEYIPSQIFIALPADTEMSNTIGSTWFLINSID